jgi:lysyl-tRNA synthetase class 2
MVESSNMATLSELRAVRMEKLEKLREFGMDAFPASIPRTHTLSEVLNSFDELSAANESISLVGRILSLRGQGAIMFVTSF